MIPFSNRFHGHGSLVYVYKNGKVARSPQMTVRYTKNSHRQKSRIAVVVSKKTLKSSVGRNRIRRRVYEYIRPILPEFNDIYDVVFIVTSRELFDMPHPGLAKQIDQLLASAGIR